MIGRLSVNRPTYQAYKTLFQLFSS